jgi:hypothetical protein
MKSLRWMIPGALLVMSGWTSSLGAQPSPKPTPGAREESFVTEKGFSSRIFEVKHRDPHDLVSVLHPLGSGFQGARIQPNRELRTISVRDFPENIAAIEAAIKRLDVPPMPRADVELRLWVLVASTAPEASTPLPEELKEVIGALKSALQYRSYALAGSFVQRVRDGARGLRGEGVTDLGEAAGAKGEKQAMQLEYEIQMLSVEQGEARPVTVRLDGFHFSLAGRGRAKIRTDVALRDGEKVVVGTSTVRDKGLAVVLSARVIR